MEELLKILNDVKPGVDFEKEKALVDDGILDSLDVISLISEIDDEFDVTIPPAMMIPENFNSAEAILNTIKMAEEDDD